MVSHVVEMAPAAAGFKLFGKVIRRASASPDGGAATAPRAAAPQVFSSGRASVEQLEETARAAAPQVFSSGRASVEQLEEAARARAAAAEALLPCPRCRSEDTKFCYFNNYNVNQPRHFCRACHRYWTAGGAIRNVPVGSGRRKNRPPPPLPHGTASAADYHRLLQSPGSMSPAPAGLTVDFPPDHHHQDNWSHTTAIPSPAYSYTGHGEMEQYRWLLLHAERPPVGSSSDRAF